MSRREKVTGVGLISGGLDSLLAAKVLQHQGVDVLGVTFDTPFWDCRQACENAKKAGIPIRVVDISRQHLEMIKNPVYGYGSNMNPCIDCHALMLKAAGEIMKQEGAHFLFTGEVLGQRPMSQRFDALRSVEKLSGYQGIILRPLSAKLLPETEVEKKGLVNRDMLLDIQGRSRKRQLELAEFFNITDYSPPGGGCLLTKEGFSRKLKALFSILPDAEVRHIEMLKHGRFFMLDKGMAFFVGRNYHDNKRLEKLLRNDREVLFSCKGIPGPKGVLVVLEEAELPQDVVYMCATIIASFSDASPGSSVEIEWLFNGKSSKVSVIAQPRNGFDDIMIK